MRRLALVSSWLLISGVMGCGGSSSPTAPPGPPAVASQWPRVNAGLPFDTQVNSFAASGTTLLAGTFGGGLFRSTDGGDHWTAATTQPTNLNLFSLAASGTTLPAGTLGGGVFRSTDGGITWAAFGSGPIASADVASLSVSGTTLFAWTLSGPGVMRYPL